MAAGITLVGSARLVAANVALSVDADASKFTDIQINPLPPDTLLTPDPAVGAATVEARALGVGGSAAATSGSGQLVGASGTRAAVTDQNDVAAALGAGAVLVGQEGVALLALAGNDTSGSATSTTLAGFAGQDATATDTIRTTARVELGDSSQVVSSGTASLRADNAVSDRAFSKTKFLGLGSLNQALSTTSVTGLGSSDPLAVVRLGEGSRTDADRVQVRATVGQARVDSDAHGEQYAAGGLIRTTSRVDAIVHTLVDQQRGAVVLGDDVSLYAGLSGLDVDSYGYGKGFGVITAHDGQAFDRVNTSSVVQTADGAILGGNSVAVTADVSGGRVHQATKRQGAGLDTSKDDFSREVQAADRVVIGGTLLGIKTAKLRVDAAGHITQSKMVSARETTTGIVVDRLNPDGTPGTVLLTANTPSVAVTTTGGTPKPDSVSTTGTVTFTGTARQQTADRFRAVDLENRSPLDLRLGTIDVATGGTASAVRVDDADDRAAGTIAAGGVYRVTGQRVDARSGYRPASDVIVTGRVLNPDGVTTLTAGRNVTLAGDVDTRKGAVTLTAGGAVGGTGLTATADLTVSARGGGLGTATTPFRVELAQDAAGKPVPALDVRTRSDVAVTLAAVAPAQTVDVRAVVAGTGGVDLRVGGNNLLLTGEIAAGPGRDVTLSGAGTISDGHSTGVDVTARNLTVTAASDVGTLANPLETHAERVEAASTGGGLFLVNRGELTVGGVRSDLTGLTAAGGIDVRTDAGPLNLTENVRGGGDVTLAAGDSAARPDDEVKLAPGIRVESTAGDLALLSGDTLHLDPSHRLVAAGVLTLGMDWGNADGGVGVTFTVPLPSTGILQADRLRILTAGDDDTIIIPQLATPTIVEAGGGNDAVTATLTDAPSARTRLTDVDVEWVTFTSTDAQPTAWLVDTVIQTTPLYGQPVPQSFRTVQLTAGTFPVVENQHSDVARLEQMQASYTFGTGADDVTVLRLEHALRIDLGGGDDTATVGGARGGAGVGPTEVVRPLAFVSGGGNDAFRLRDLRDTPGLTPVGRLDRLDATTGIVRDYGRDQEAVDSPRTITFAGFDAVQVDLGPTDALFTLNNTVAPTTVDAGGGDDVVNVRRIAHPTTVDAGAGDDDINVQGVGDLLTVRGGGNVRSLDLPEGGDRLRVGVTRSFTDAVVNVLGMPNAIGLLGHGWFTG